MVLSGFSRYILRTHPDLVGRRVLVALSGGADSIALLHLLLEPGLRVEVVAAHVHHRLRGTEADRDAAFCVRTCAGLGVPIELLELEPAADRGEGREADWRRRRYRALHRAAARIGAAAVATGHHRDDVAEGVLMQLLRGAGPRALAGIHAATDDGLVRPLLPWTRAEIRSWLTDRGIPWREDASNLSPAHLRNVVRHRILPDLAGHAPRVSDHLARIAEALSRDERFLASELALRARWIDPWHPHGGVPAAEVAELPAALRVRWLHVQVARLGLGRATRRQGELLERLLAGEGPRAVTLPGRWRLRLAAGHLWAEPPSPPEPTVAELVEGTSVPLGVPGWRIRLCAPGRGATGSDGWTWQPPATARLRIRSVRPGERLPGTARPMRAAALLARALPRHLRLAWPVVVADDTIAWIPGVWRNPEQPGDGPMEVEVTRR